MPVDVGLLGKVSDAEIGRLNGLSRERVRQIREEHGITPFKGTPGRSKAQRIADALDALDANELALIAVDAGKKPDATIAKHIGLDVKLVALYRQRNNIPVYTPPPAYTDEQIRLLRSDISAKEAAERVKCSLMTVWRYRHRRATD